VHDVKVLGFDTAMAALSAAIWADGKIAASRFQPMERGHAEALMGMIDEVCREAKLDMASFDRIGVTRGPGTFTGQRIGLAAARALVLGLRADVVGITTFEAVAAGVEDGDPKEAIASVFDARRGQVYVQAFAADRTALSPPEVLNIDAAAAMLERLEQEKLVLVGSGAQLVLEPLHQGCGKTVRLSHASPLPDARLVAQLAASRGISAGTVSPLYLRPPDAKLPNAGT
jgi:tRNA threonylcarbamoyladenosine biosynthesis protein TsaB